MRFPHRRQSFLPSLALTALMAGCASLKGGGTEPEDGTLGGLSEAMLPAGDHLLFRPEGEPTRLLGREVTVDEEGHPLIAEARRPGCEVLVREVPQAYRGRYSQAVERVAGLQLEVWGLGAMRASSSRALSVESDVENVHVLEAELTAGS